LAFGSLVFFALAGFVAVASTAGAPALASSACFLVSNGPCSAAPSLGTTQHRAWASFLTETAGVAVARLVGAFLVADFVVLMDMVLPRVGGSRGRCDLRIAIA
jgi:hypothetical protein